MATPEVIKDKFEGAGFKDVEIEVISAPVRLISAAECLRFERESFGALHQMLSGLPEAEREEVWKDIEVALERFETADGFVGPCEMNVIAATK